MMKLTAIIFGIIIVLSSFSIAEARHNDGLKGLVIGGSGGAPVGHVITESPEGVIVGSFLGGTIGLLIDSEHNKHVVVVKNRHRYPRHWSRHSYKGRWPHRGDRHYKGRYGHKYSRFHRVDRHYNGRHGHKYRRSYRGDRHNYGRHENKYSRDRHRGRYYR